MILYRVLMVAIVGWFLASVATSQCWECEALRDEQGNTVYPGVECAEVSVSDEGKTECYVLVDPNLGGRCVFENIATGQPGQACSWEPPPGSGHTIPPEQGCEWSDLQSAPGHQITPNGETVIDWEPKTPVIDAAVG